MKNSDYIIKRHAKNEWTYFSCLFKALGDVELKVSIFPCGGNGCQFNSAIRDTPTYISDILYQVV